MKYTNKEASIVLLYPFFGRLPWYFPYFIHTCKYNPSVDFIVFTDNEPPFELPPNVSFVWMSFTQFKETISQKLGFQVELEPQPYKFCDLRPAFGEVFDNYIKDYDFWGHGDTDVIFGNIRNFLTDEILAEHDIICLRHDYISSWFTLYRNTPKLNSLFRQSKDYEKVFTTPKYFNFDETNLTFFEFAHLVPYQLIKSEVESMTHLVKRLHDEQYIKAYFDMHAIEGKPGRTKWMNGRLIYKNKFEVLLYHLLELKKVYKPKAAPAVIPDVFYISETRIYGPRKNRRQTAAV